MNLKKNRLLALTIGLLTGAFSLQASAQADSGRYTISGTIVDSAKREMIANASIIVMDESKRTLASGISSPAGAFRIMSPRASRYLMQITVVGYSAKNVELDIEKTGGPEIRAGIIYLNKDITALKTVVVTGDKPLVKQEIDRISYDLQADPQSKSNSVLEMMRKVPFITLDAEENILLKGNSSYRIFINGKPSSMMERNAKEVLRSMPASTIQRIEVITNPPSKYDAEGLAGIINIVTNKKTGNGYNGSVNLSERFPVGGPGIGASFAAKEGRLGISAYGGASVYRMPSTQNRLDRYTTGNEQTNLHQDSRTGNKNRNGYLGTEISYEIDSLQLLSAQFNVNGSRGSGYNYLQSTLGAKTGTVQGYTLNNDNKGNGTGADASLNYQLGFKKDKSRLLTFSYRYFEYGNRQNSQLDINDRLNYLQPDFQQDNRTHAAENTVQADYVQQYKKLFIEAGVKAIFRGNESDFQYHAADPITGKYELVPGMTNQFDYRQNIAGAYNTYQYNWKKWEFKGGARIEQTFIDADFRSTGTNLRQRYFNVIPSVAVKRSLKNDASLNFGYTQRIKRPGINRLNPFIDRSNPNYESSGNPELRPVLNNRFQLGYGYSKKLSLNTGLDFSFVKNIDLRVSAFDPSTNITKSTYRNTGKATAIDYSLNLNYPITKRWNASLNGNISFIWIEGFVGSSLIRSEWFLYSANTSMGYRFNQGWRANANLSIISRNPTSLQGTSNGMVISSFSLSKELVKNKLSFSAGVNNPFTKYRTNRVDTWGPDFTELVTNRNYFRQFNASANYNFGKLKQAIRKNKRGIRNDDVSEGKGM